MVNYEAIEPAGVMVRKGFDMGSAAVGQLSAELICPYPPGIPVLVPGELITAEALELLRSMKEAGCSLTGCTDPQLRSLAVLDT